VRGARDWFAPQWRKFWSKVRNRQGKTAPKATRNPYSIEMPLPTLKLCSGSSARQSHLTVTVALLVQRQQDPGLQSSAIAANGLRKQSRQWYSVHRHAGLS